MTKIKNVEVWHRVGETKTDYIMYFEWEGLWFSRVWGLANDATIEPAYVAEIFLTESQEEVDRYPDQAKTIGSENRPSQELGPEWERFDF